ncbi:MAG: spermidine/putrescine ABC transporter permease [Acidiferrobacter sp.]|nr:spermidine/putrescine ABC transporter permease [Acidiferrobacter sp.]MBR42450.1 spermidine/putrescine ABC transporter permease [Acidiferrobacter sp.]
MERQDQRIGLLSAVPMGAVLLISFLAPLMVIAIFSVMPQKVFSLLHLPDFSSYKLLFTQGYIKSVLWSFGMAMASTAILFVICWPLAFGMAKVFKGFGLFITIAVVITLFVSENIRLFGWVLTLMKGGLIEGHLRAWTGLTFEGALYNVPVIVFGLVYAYFPFMLFPLIQGIAMVPDDARQAAADLGASRRQIFFEVDLPLSAPGIVIGSLLSFVLAAGAMAESKLLGGQTVIVIADEIETAFTYGQNWPLGSALSVVLILIIGALSIFGINRVNLDLIMGGRRS